VTVRTAVSVRGVVFDIDDTLYLERDYVRSGFRVVGAWVREHLAIDDFEERCRIAFERGARRAVFDGCLRSAGCDPEPALVATLVSLYRGHRPAIALLPDALDCLARLHGHLFLGAITDGPIASQRAKAVALRLERWLDPLVFTAELGEGNGKPSPAAFRSIESSWGLRGAECAYVADNPAKDFGGPASIGWRTVRIRRAGGLHRDEQGGADVELEIESLADLDSVIGRVSYRSDPSLVERSQGRQE
jgi:putative hydrolase of the HAD superfamily